MRRNACRSSLAECSASERTAPFAEGQIFDPSRKGPQSILRFSFFPLFSVGHLRAAQARMRIMSCYQINSNSIKTANNDDVLCNSNGTSYATTQQCCHGGDTCLGSSICYFTRPQEKTGGFYPQEKTSGFYVGGCTQESFPGPVCSKKCSEYSRWLLLDSKAASAPGGGRNGDP